jgi:hypothetical protein
VNRSVGTLLLVLVIQCLILATVYWPGSGRHQQASREPMLAFGPDAVNEIYIGDEYDNETVVRRAGDRWVLPELEQLPADSARIEALLAGITSSENDWPVADSIAARQRFQVASYHYQRRLRLLNYDELLATLYLGTSPGHRKVHARNDSQDAIYSIPFNTFDAPGVSGAWLDRKLLQIRTPLGITADSYSLRREGGKWRSGLDREPDERELLALLSGLRSLQVSGVAREDLQRDLADAEPELVLEVTSLAGDVTLELFTIDTAHFVHSSKYPFFFTLDSYNYDRLTSIDFRLISGEDTAN